MFKNSGASIGTDKLHKNFIISIAKIEGSGGSWLPSTSTIIALFLPLGKKAHIRFVKIFRGQITTRNMFIIFIKGIHKICWCQSPEGVEQMVGPSA